MRLVDVILGSSTKGRKRMVETFQLRDPPLKWFGPWDKDRFVEGGDANLLLSSGYFILLDDRGFVKKTFDPLTGKAYEGQESLAPLFRADVGRPSFRWVFPWEKEKVSDENIRTLLEKGLCVGLTEEGKPGLVLDPVTKRAWSNPEEALQALSALRMRWVSPDKVEEFPEGSDAHVLLKSGYHLLIVNGFIERVYDPKTGKFGTMVEALMKNPEEWGGS